MMIDFNAMETVENSNMLGGEGTILMKRYLDDDTKLLLVTLKPGCSIGEHVHSTSYEACYCVSGNAKMIYDGVEERMAPGRLHYCPYGHSHTCINDSDEDFVMYCVVGNK